MQPVRDRAQTHHGLSGSKAWTFNHFLPFVNTRIYKMTDLNIQTNQKMKQLSEVFYDLK